MSEIMKTLGGDRLGSGNKMKVAMHNYERSSFNQSRTWMSSMKPGLLYPCFNEIGTNGDKFEMKIKAGLMTNPTIGPCFGKFKLQVDVFAVPMRLYNAVLHNDTLNVGQQMSKVLFPVLDMKVPKIWFSQTLTSDVNKESRDKIIMSLNTHPTSLLNYLGLKSVGTPYFESRETLPETRANSITVDFNAVGIMSYFDIYKCYYTNKQEKQCHVISYLFNDSNNDGVGEFDRDQLIQYRSQNIEVIDNAKAKIMEAWGLDKSAKMSSMGGFYYDMTNPAVNSLPHAGLAIKTYQSDLFNNYLNKEYAANTDLIASVSSATITNGKLSMDALNLAEKVYNMMNRIAVSGSSYQDWQEAVYAEISQRRAESPIYCGGISAEIAFDEVVSTAETVNANRTTALGALAGKGVITDVKSGEITITCVEPTYIMAVASITPKISYSQGNKFWIRWKSFDDLHKPALDGVGFQNLVVERYVAKSTLLRYTIGAEKANVVQSVVGKTPAYIDYMTAVDENFGLFASGQPYNYMVLDRDYDDEWKVDSVSGPGGRVPVDNTTYIHQNKYDYIFADSSEDTDNFLVKLYFECVSRRKMSAKIIPNL